VNALHKLDASEIEELEKLRDKPRNAGSDRSRDNIRKRLKRIGLIWFDRASWEWTLTSAGLDVLQEKQNDQAQ
jgi:hypothetical protein